MVTRYVQKNAADRQPENIMPSLTLLGGKVIIMKHSNKETLLTLQHAISHVTNLYGVRESRSSVEPLLFSRLL